MKSTFQRAVILSSLSSLVCSTLVVPVMAQTQSAVVPAAPSRFSSPEDQSGDLHDLGAETLPVEDALLSQLDNPLLDGPLLAQNSATSAGGRKTVSRQTSSGGMTQSKQNMYMAKASQLGKAGKFMEASKLLFQMSRRPEFAAQSAQIKYVLGLMLFEMKLNQSAAFVLYDVVHQERGNPNSRFLRQSLGKLAVAADALESDALLRYAIKQVPETEFPAASRDMLYYRLGEIKMEDKQFTDAAVLFARVRSSSIFYTRARYKLALAYAEANDGPRAEAAFDEIVDQNSGGKVTNVNRVTGLLGKARVLYQEGKFAESIDAYSDIPRDTEQWHEALFESSWAMVRDGRFRSALSNFHSLHSAYYDDFYQPESLLLRAIVYLYICRYGEMEKVLTLFERIYKPVQRDLHNFYEIAKDPSAYYRELAKVAENLDVLKAKTNRRDSAIPFLVARQILKEGDVRHSLNYIQKLEEERKRINALAPAWISSGVGQYSKTLVEKRLDAAKILAGKQIRRHLVTIHNNLRAFFEQSDLIRYEMLSGKKESIRKEIAGKAAVRTVDQDNERSFYIQNGYEYWPFKGEYWLDEIGNYHYVGVKACE